MRSCSFGRKQAANGRCKKCSRTEIRLAACSRLAVSRAWRRAGTKVAVPGRRAVQMLDPHLHEAATGSFRGNAVRAGRRRDRQRACSADPGCEAVVAAAGASRRRDRVTCNGWRRGGEKKELRGWEEELPRNELEFKFRDL